jgi:hypothetical protein
MKLFTNFLDLAVLEMNLKKYTKADLISKVENLQNKMNSKSTRTNSKFLINQIKIYFSQTWDLILTFKNLLFKLTLISLIIQTFKRFTLFRKLWLIINSIIMAIFGISLYDNGLFNFFSNFITEFRFITWGVIDYLTNTNFYQYLSNLFGKNEIAQTKDAINQVKKEIIKEAKNEIVSEINQGGKLTERELKPYNKSKFVDLIKPGPKITWIESEVEDVNYYKYILIATGVVIVGTLGWYYSDEIKTGFTGAIDWILSFRSGGTIDPGNSSNSSSTATVTNIPIASPSNSSNIELIDKTDKGKARAVMTSPSLENLNDQARESWENYSRPMSPSSSQETITPLTINTSEVSPDSPSSSSSSDTIVPNYSSSSSETVIASKVNLDNSNSLLTIDIVDFIKKNWKEKFDKETRNKISFVEANIGKPLNDDIEGQIVDYIGKIIVEYNKEVNAVNNLKNFPYYENQALEIEGNKHGLFYLREWIGEYYEKVIEKNDVFKIGTLDDSPEIIKFK